ncbi:hypothetical protein ACFSFY_10470 [Sporosarcina siberiensis]|uniref:Uncharacterized protein n=1 Tax=Sporosarcina siberiensis TaxID=1365606 RepID=A0ABW4SG69_9BACL
MHGTVKPLLRKLEKMDNVTYGKVQTELTKALTKPLGNKSTASKVSSFIVELMKVFGP